MRACGILLHISSLPGSGGIGCMGRQAYQFVDFLSAAGQRYWQILPLTPPASGNSPYSSYSVFAGNPYLIDLQALVEDALLPEQALADLPQQNTGSVDFAQCEAQRIPLLRMAYANGHASLAGQIEAFRQQNRSWLADYALFMALKHTYGGLPYRQWPKPLLLREESALAAAQNELCDEISFTVFVQYLFYTQWQKLKDYASERGVLLIGDMPIYADVDSADCWANPQVFLQDENRSLTAVAGVPPDDFCADGQLWGNPLYDWQYLEQTGYAWWINRMAAAAKLYDVVRIDHFRGLDSYFAVENGALTAKDGTWRQGPGIAFLEAVKAAVPNLALIAEDLGVLTPSVYELLAQSGLPGMKILLFAFDPWQDSCYLPHKLPQNCVAYVGTHDNNTVQGWLQEAPKEHVAFAAEYLGFTPQNAHWGFIRGLYECLADTAIVAMQDFLGLDAAARMNIPGVAEGNWGWRMAENAATPALAEMIKALAVRYNRCGKENT